MANGMTGRERMVRIVGERYADCDFTTFDVGADKYTELRVKAGNAVFAYAHEIEEHRRRGTNLILAGPIGTGKDHLAAAVVRAALSKGLSAVVVRGSVLMKEMLAAIKAGEELDERYSMRDVLVLSDIEPRTDEVASTFFQESLLDLVDARYRDLRVTIVTTNIESRAAMDRAIGVGVVDRLLQCAVIVRTSWPSIRKGL